MLSLFFCSMEMREEPKISEMDPESPSSAEHVRYSRSVSVNNVLWSQY